jgi:hypothetical protein
MAFLLFANNATTTLAGGIASNATSFNVAAGTGALFPSPATGYYFEITLVSQSNAQAREIVYVTSRSNDTFSGVQRGQEGTTPLAFSAGDGVNNWWTAGSAAIMTQASQLQQQAGNYAVDTGTTNNVAATILPAPGSLSLIAGAPFRIKISYTNTGSSTLTITLLPSTVITNPDGTTLTASQLIAGHVYEFVYNGSTFDLIGNPYQLLNRANTWTAANTFGVISASQLTVSNNAAVNGSFTVAGTASVNGQITGGARILATLGARGSGIGNAATILSDFVRGASGGYMSLSFPDGSMIQGNVGVNATGGDAITFNNPFPTACAEVVVMEGAPAGWDKGTGQLFPTIYGAQNISRTGFVCYCAAWGGSGSPIFSYGLNTTYRYIAIGY